MENCRPKLAVHTQATISHVHNVIFKGVHHLPSSEPAEEPKINIDIDSRVRRTREGWEGKLSLRFRYYSNLLPSDLGGYLGLLLGWSVLSLLTSAWAALQLAGTTACSKQIH